MNILHISAVKNWGGGEKHIENLYFELKRIAPEVTSHILCVANSKFHQKLREADIPNFQAPLDLKVDPRYMLIIIRLCKKLKIDLIHIHDPTALTLVVMADKFANLPPFIFSKKTTFPIKERKQTLFKYNYPKIRRILCVSKETHRISSLNLTDTQRLKTIYHGTRLDDKSTSTPFGLREHLNIPANKKIVGTIGNHIPAKNLETWVDTVNELVHTRERSDLFFVQIGDFTEYTADLTARIQELGLEEHVAMLGFTPQASNFIPQFDLLLVTSQSEGIPQVIYEAFYHKIPVVSTEVGGIPEIITHQHNGLLAPKGNSAELASNILETLEQPELTRHFTNRSYKTLIENFSTEQMAWKTLEQYKQVVEETSFCGKSS